jgi:hypothetical protein
MVGRRIAVWRVWKIKSTWIKDNISKSAERFEAVTDVCMGRPRKKLGWRTHKSIIGEAEGIYTFYGVF